jgi:hypothetical protein
LADYASSQASSIHTMPDNRRHRGPHPLDEKLFAPDKLSILREAVGDYAWLLGRGYAAKSALDLVGNRYSLHERQRKVVMRATCSPQAQKQRAESEINSLENQIIWLDGYNILTTIEAALSGGLIVCSVDNCYRDIASLHGTFRSVEETIPAIEIVGLILQKQGAQGAVLLLDSPVSNSGRLKTMLHEIAVRHNWNWNVELVFSPDAALKQTDKVIATADGVILDSCKQWFNLARHATDESVPQAWIIDLQNG